MYDSIGSFRIGALQKVKQLDALVNKHMLADKVVADHICFKCESAELYAKMRDMLSAEREFLYESDVAERKVSYIKLKKEAGIQTIAGHIRFVELADKKPHKPEGSKFHHIEIYPIGGLGYVSLVDIFRTNGENVDFDNRLHHPTHDVILDDFIVRISQEPLLLKIKREEMTLDGHLGWRS